MLKLAEMLEAGRKKLERSEAEEQQKNQQLLLKRRQHWDSLRQTVFDLFGEEVAGLPEEVPAGFSEREHTRRLEIQPFGEASIFFEMNFVNGSWGFSRKSFRVPQVYKTRDEEDGGGIGPLDFAETESLPIALALCERAGASWREQQEILAAARAVDFEGDPEEMHMWDLRVLNDIDVPDAVRTECLPAVWRAYTGSLDWPIERQLQVSKNLALLIVQRLLPALPGYPETILKQCEEAKTLAAAGSAAWSAAMLDAGSSMAQLAAEATLAAEAAQAAAQAAAWATQAAAKTVERAAKALERSVAVWTLMEEEEWTEWAREARSARERVFRLGCAIFLKAAS